MDSRIARRLPGPFRTVAVAFAMVLVACLSATGTGVASEDPVVDIPNEAPLSARCERAVNTFFAEIDWILSHDSDHPRMEDHVDTMWRAWEIAEFECGIDVGGDGEIG